VASARTPAWLPGRAGGAGLYLGASRLPARPAVPAIEADIVRATGSRSARHSCLALWRGWGGAAWGASARAAAPAWLSGLAGGAGLYLGAPWLATRRAARWVSLESLEPAWGWREPTCSTWRLSLESLDPAALCRLGAARRGHAGPAA
jgi:hypothetical protein